MTTFTDPPVFHLDFDGVLNAWGPYPGATTKNRRMNALWGCKMERGEATCNGRPWTIKWAPPLVQRLIELHESGAVEFRWSSSWNSEIENVERLLGLPKWPIAFEAAGLHWTVVAQKKRRAAAHVQDVEGRRLIWADDNEAPHHWELAHAAMTLDGRALLVRPKEALGLCPQDLDAIDVFCGRATVLPVEELLHIQQIGSTLTICGGGEGGRGQGTYPGNETCADCTRIYKEANA